MIIGNGMIARAFSSYAESKGLTIFASGVSNSKEASPDDYDRERNLLQNNLNRDVDHTLVYFSTCSIDDPTMRETGYVNHKLEMESLIKRQNQNFVIFRLPQAVGTTSNSTIIKFLHDKIQNAESFELWENSFRNLIDIEDVFKISEYILSHNMFSRSIINIASPINTSIPAIVEILENLIGKRAVFTRIEKGAQYTIDISLILEIIKSLGIKFDVSYPSRIVQKYYGLDRKFKISSEFR